jgi:thiamine biosynthesis lipoprotein ApbE
MESVKFGRSGKSTVTHIAIRSSRSSSGFEPACGSGWSGWAFEFGERQASPFVVVTGPKRASCQRCRKLAQ